MTTKIVKIALYLSFIIFYSILFNPPLNIFHKCDTMFFFAGVHLYEIIWQ
jgi:hypothetical protein